MNLLNAEGENLAAVFAGKIFYGGVTVTIIELYQNETLVLHKGRVTQPKFDEDADTLTLVCETGESYLNRNILTRKFQGSCPNSIYDRWCGLDFNKWSFEVKVTAIDGLTVSFTVVPKHHANALSDGKPLVVRINQKEDDRSKAQNRLLHMWFGQIAKFTGDEPEFIKFEMKKKFLAKIYLQDRAETQEAYDQLDVVDKQREARQKSARAASSASQKASKAALTQQKRDAKEADRLKEEQYDLRERIAYEYKDRILKIEKDLENEIADIQKANFSPKDTTGYIENAKHRADLEKKLYVAQLTENVSAWRLSEERKLELKKTVNNLMIQLDSDMNDDFKNQALQSAEDQYLHELGLIKLAKEQRLFQMREALLSETEAMQERYRLEREQILLNSGIDKEEKQRQIDLSKAAQQEENRRRLNGAIQQWGQTQADMNGAGDQFALEQERFDRYDQSQALFDTQMALAETAEQREAIWQAHHERMTAIESAYQHNSYSLQLGYGEQVTGALSNMFGKMLGESSSTYQTLFYAQRSFALAQAGMNVWKSASDAYANEPGTVWQKMGAAALATIESGTFVSMIEAATPVGMAHDGIDNIPKEGTWLLDKGERVVDSRTNADLKGMIANQKNGGNITIQVNITESGVSTSGGTTQDQKQLGQMIGNAVRTVIRQEQRQGGLLAR